MQWNLRRAFFGEDARVKFALTVTKFLNEAVSIIEKQSKTGSHFHMGRAGAQ
jgi:hypothetical protein